MTAATFIVVVDISKSKTPFDKEKKTFRLMRDWFRYRWDNILVKTIGGLLGAILASELGAPLLKKLSDSVSEFPDLTNGAIDLTSIAICTIFGAWLFNKIIPTSE